MADLISILLPVYNAQPYLRDCLRSIQHQTYQAFEVVAVDDGSTDGSPLILSEFVAQDSRFRVLSLPRNGGIVAALNHGLNACRGEWIARMDADDIMHPRRLELQRQYFDAHPETDILGARVRVFREDGELTVGQKRYQDWGNSLLTDEAIKRDMFAESPVMHPTFFLRSSTYRNMEGYQDNPWAEDYDFLLRAYLKQARFAKLPEVLVEKRDTPARLARTDVRCKRKAMFRAKAHYFVKDRGLQDRQTCLIAGSGSSGRLACSALRQEGVVLHGFVDNGEVGRLRTVAGLPVYALDYQQPEPLLTRLGHPFFFLCIGEPAGRQAMETLLQQRGYTPSVDYCRFI
ncbi:glycosyltransferase [bacterium]|nr:glycosyltransferase [bacterium]